MHEQLEKDPFGCVIGTEGVTLVAVHTTAIDLYTRLWCLYEINEAIAQERDVTAATSAKYQNKLYSRYIYWLEYTDHKGEVVKSEKKCYIKEF